VRLEWSIFAQADRDAIFDCIEQDSPRAAMTVDNRIRVQIESLAQFSKERPIRTFFDNRVSLTLKPQKSLLSSKI
jgi:plasmid stabilization system protein ParE